MQEDPRPPTPEGDDEAGKKSPSGQMLTMDKVVRRKIRDVMQVPGLTIQD